MMHFHLDRQGHGKIADVFFKLTNFDIKNTTSETKNLTTFV